MAEDMDGVDVFTALEVIGNLLQAIALAIQYYYFGARLETLEKLLFIGDVAIDEHHFLTLVAGRCGRGGIADLLATILDGLRRICSREPCVGYGCGHRAVKQHARLQRNGQGGVASRLNRSGGGLGFLRPEHIALLGNGCLLTWIS